MLSRLIFICITAFCLLEFSTGSPQTCQETTINYNAIYRNYSIMLSADLKLTVQNQNSSITVSNINGTAVKIGDTDTQVSFKQMCAYERAGQILNCNKQFTDALTIMVGDSNVWELQATIAYKSPGYEEDDSPPFYSGVVDGNSFSFYDGRLFDENNKCYNYVYNDGATISINITECCTSMKQITMNDVNNTQTCTHFTSTSNVTAADKSTYATVAIDYDIKDFNVTMFGRFSGPAGFTPYLIIDDAQGCDEVLNNSIYCGYPLSVGGNKMLTFLGEATNMTQVYGLISKIIIRDNQTYIADDTLTSSDNKCQTSTYPYDSNRGLSIVTTTCCTMSTGDNTASSPSPGGSTTTTSGSISFTYSLSFFFAIFVAFMVFKV